MSAQQRTFQFIRQAADIVKPIALVELFEGLENNRVHRLAIDHIVPALWQAEQGTPAGGLR